MRVIPTRTPDVEAALIAALNDAQSVPVRNIRPRKNNVGETVTGPTPGGDVLPGDDVFPGGDELTIDKVLVLRADLQQKVTPISRYCRVGIQGWSIRPDGRADLGDAFDITAEAGRQLELLAGTGIIIHAEVESGPARVADPESRIEYQYLTALLEVSVT